MKTTGFVKVVPRDPLVGYKLRLKFEQNAFTDLGDTKPSEIWFPVMRETDLLPDFTFVFDLPGLKADSKNTVMRGPWTLELLSARGEVIAAERFEAWPERLGLEASPQQPFVIAPANNQAEGRRLRLNGRVLDRLGKQQVANTQVLIYGKTMEAQDNKPLVAVTTDKNGYFSCDYPGEKLQEAFAVIAIGENGKREAIALEQNLLPRNVLLVVDMPEQKPEDHNDEDCHCHDATSVPRTPDPEDRAHASETYSMDLGTGRCVDFNTPNRSIEEFSFYKIVRTTDPTIRGISLGNTKPLPNAIVDKFSKLALEHYNFGAFALNENANTPTAPVSLSAKLRTAAGVEALASAPGDAVAALVAKKDLRLSASVMRELSRDPDQFTPVDLMTAERRTAMREVSQLVKVLSKPHPERGPLNADNPVDWDDTPTFYQATTIAHGHVLHFKQIWRADGYSLGDLLYSLPLAPGQKKQIIVMDWERREQASRNEFGFETEDLAASLSRERDLGEVFSTMLQENVRGGSEASTWAAGGGIGFALGPVVIGGGGGGGGASSSAWQDSSRSLSGSSLQQLRDKTLQAASAVRSKRATVVTQARQGERMRVESEVIANHNHCHAMTVQYFEVLRHLKVTQELADVQECLFVPLEITAFDRHKTLRWRAALRSALRDRSLAGGFEAIERIMNNYDGSDLPIGAYADETLQTLEGHLYLNFQLARPKDNNDAFDPNAWQFLQWLMPSLSAADFYKQFLKDQNFKDRVFQEQLAPRIAENFVNFLQFYALTPSGLQRLPIDATLASRYTPDVPLHISLRMDNDLPPVARRDIRAVVVSARLPSGPWPFGSFLSAVLPANSKVIVTSGALQYRTAHLQHDLFRNGGISNDLTGFDDVRVETPLARAELREPRREDRELAQRLVTHLNEHLEYYHRAIWTRMDSERRFMLLDGFVAPFTTPARSVASVVENRLLGIIGNSLVMPVAPGFRLDPTYKKTEDGQDTANDLFELYRPLTPIAPMTVSLPTQGVFAEAVLGNCNSCETLDDTRFWRWQDSPIDEPTALQAPGMESRYQAPQNTTPTPFTAPIVAFQNAPAAPDPAGLGAAIQAITNPNIFRDITGLEGNQRNALAAFQTAMDTAKFFGGEAAKLELQRQSNNSADRNLQRIRQAKQAGNITPDQANDLTLSALRGSVGGGASQPETRLTEDPEVQNLIRSRANDNTSNVSISRPSGEKVEVSSADSGSNGLPLSSAPSPRNPTTERARAVQMIETFRKGTRSAWHKSVRRDEVANRLIELVNKPDGLDQGAFGFCGPAAFFNTWIQADPVAFIRYATTLYEEGEASIGSKSVSPGHFLHGDDIRDSDYDAIKKKVIEVKGRPMLPAADWMVMGAFQDANNSWWTGDFEGDPDEEDQLGVGFDDMQDWLEATKLFGSVQQGASSSTTKTYESAKGLVPTANRYIMLGITAHLISAGNKKTGHANHYVMLRTPIVKDAADKITFRVWTWGGERDVSTTLVEFEKMYFGAVVAE